MAQQVCEDKSRGEIIGSSSSNGFCYTEVSSSNNPMNIHHHHHHQGFVSDPAEMFNLTSNMDIIGFSPKNNNNSTYMWKSFLGKPSGQQHAVAVADTAPSPSPNSNSTSKTMNNNNNTFYHQHDFTPTAGGGGVSVSETTISGSGGTDQNLMVHHHHHDSSAAATWRDDNNRLMMVDDSSSMVFPCEGNERPSQGLSLSLSSTNPSNIALQSFQLIRNTATDDTPSTTVHHHHQQNIYHHQGQQQQQQFLLKNSKFLLPLQDLLNEFCGLGNDVLNHSRHSQKKHWEDDNNNNMKHSLEFVDLQKRKTKLLSMLEEVDRRYKHYCNQMKAVVSSFEAVAGSGAAVVYSALALKAMSRHFRCLKDGIMEQIEATRKGMGEKDSIAPAGATRGETPRLRMLDRALRQQRAFQQINMMESHPWRPQRGLPERSVSILRAWLFEHFLHPYPSDVDKHILARQTGLSRSQVSNWFINARVRLWKPMVEEMYLEEEKEQQRNKSSGEGGGGGGYDIDHEEEGEEEEDNNINTISTTNNIINIQMPSPTQIEDQKPRLLRIDSECVSSSIINNNNTADPNPKSSLLNPHDHDEQQFGSVDIDFSSYSNTHHQQHSENMVSYNDQSFHGGSGGGVSLTLGLQQHGGGVSLAFPAAVAVAGTQSQMFFTREQIEECEPVIHQHHQYSLLDGEGQNMQYRNLMGSHLLHHLP